MARALTSGALTDRVDFGRIRYANCWEDAEILCQALLGGSPATAPGEHLLASGVGAGLAPARGDESSIRELGERKATEFGASGAFDRSSASPRRAGASPAPTPEHSAKEQASRRCSSSGERAHVSGGRILSIASGGDNVFALLASGADEVVAADLSAAQLAVVELKAAAIRRRSREETLRFFGIAPCKDRLSTYALLEDDLSTEARAFWSKNRALIQNGLIHQGKFERYLGVFRRFVLPLVHSRSTIKALTEPRDLEQRRRFFEDVWNTRRWSFVFRLFFSRFVMGRLGRDPELFRFVEGAVSERILRRARHALTELSTHDNPYLEYILTGTFKRNLPLYLRAGAFETLKSVLAEEPQRLVLERGDIAEVARKHARQGFDGFNLSDVFEYLDAETSATLYRSLLGVARPGARFAYWNLLAPRQCPESLREHVEQLPVGAVFHHRDQAFFYSAFHVEAVR